jgi:hypothetical protein
MTLCQNRIKFIKIKSRINEIEDHSAMGYERSAIGHERSAITSASIG